MRRFTHRDWLTRAVPIALWVGVFALYASTAAPGTVFGDPSEYQFIPAIGGIAHPPGYAFYTLLAKLWQTLVPLGSGAFRTNLLASAVGAGVVTAVYFIVLDLGQAISDQRAGSPLIPLFSALALAAAPDLWQHAAHANAHIVSAALAMCHLALLVRWWRTGKTGWLAGFAVTLGLAASHHPVTLMGAPAYAVFILVVRPRILREWRMLLVLLGCLLVGLLPFLYFPLRSPSAPFGPTDMRTWEGFIGHATARGLRVNLFHFGLADQPDRVVGFASLLALQFAVPTLCLLPFGAARLARRAAKPALLLGIFLFVHLAFTMNTVQDVMAYLLLPFSALAIVVGAGAHTVVSYLVSLSKRLARSPVRQSAYCCIALVVLVLMWPVLQAVNNLSRGISLRDFTAAEEYVQAVHDQFAGKGQGAVLVSDWEHLTPLWVHYYTQGAPLSEQDVRLVYVSASSPWVESVQAHLDEGPVYLPDYRPSVRAAGFRLVPWNGFYRVFAPGTASTNPAQPLVVWVDQQIRIFGYDLPETTVRAGEHLELVLYQTAPEPVSGIWMPYAQLGPVEARWTTDSRLLTPDWLPGEQVVERYEVPVPFTLAPGQYPLRLGYSDLSGGRPELALSTGGTAVELAMITVLPSERVPERVGQPPLANLDNQVSLVDAWAWAGTQVRQNNWQEPINVRAGQPVHLLLSWQALTAPRESYTVFIHLLDEAGRYVSGHDYTPLGGAAPTYLWFPKWLPGQTVLDPYRLVLPADLPSGTYWLQVGMYGMTSLRRLPVVDSTGNLAGDRIILGGLRVE